MIRNVDEVSEIEITRQISKEDEDAVVCLRSKKVNEAEHSDEYLILSEDDVDEEAPANKPKLVQNHQQNMSDMESTAHLISRI